LFKQDLGCNQQWYLVYISFWGGSSYTIFTVLSPAGGFDMDFILGRMKLSLGTDVRSTSIFL